MADDTTGELISPYDQRIYKVPADKHEEYKAAGWAPPSDAPIEGEVHSHIANWREMGGVESAVYSASHGFLGLPWLIEKGSAAVGHDDWAKAYADSLQMAAEQHPYIDAAARLTTGIGSAALYTAGAAAAAPALGLGALGAGAAEAGAGAALGAEGASALAGAAGVSEGAVAAGEAVLGAGEAATGAGQAASTLSTYGKLAARFGAEGAAIGVVDRYDQAAILHAASPEGQEKIVWSVSEIAQDAALNAALGVGVVSGLKGLAKLGKSIEGYSTTKMTDALLNKVSAEQVELQGRTGDLRQMAKEILPMGIERGRVHVDNLVDVAEKEMNQLKFTIEGKGNYFTPEEEKALRESVESRLGGTVENSRIQKMIDDAVNIRQPQLGTDPPGALNPQKLQDIRKNIYDMINFKNFGGRPIDVKLRDTALEFGDHIKDLFEKADTSLGKEYAARWATQDKTYSNALLLKSALRAGGDTLSFAGLITKVVSAGAVGAVVGATGFMGGPLAAAKTSASFKAIQSFNAGHLAAFGKGIGAVMSTADRKLGSTVFRNLRNTPVVARNYFSPGEYTQLAAKLSKIGQDPTTAATNIKQTMDQAGVPEDMALDLTGKLHAQNMYLVNQLVHNTGPADMPTLAHGDPVKLRKVVGQARTMADPTHGIDNPTSANLEVLKKFYPQTLLTAQTAVYEQIRKNPRMSPQTKQWASRILGRPINNLSSPRFSTMLAQSRAASQQAAQAAGGPSKGSKRSSGGEDAGSQTRLDELQGDN